MAVDKIDKKTDLIKCMQAELDHRAEVEKEAEQLITDGKHEEAVALFKSLDDNAIVRLQTEFEAIEAIQEEKDNMNNIIIVEDILERGITLAQQFEEFALHNQDLDIHVLAVCYFNPDRKNAEGLIAKRKAENGGEFAFEIKPVSLWNFDDVLDAYTDPQGTCATAIMDFMLKGDGSRGIPTQRVNIRYARRADEDRKKKLKFYTATGPENEKIFCTLFGKDHILQVEEFQNATDFLHLHLDRDVFINKLQTNAAAG